MKLSALAEDLAAALPELRLGELLDVRIGGDGASRGLQATWARTFGDVAQGAPLLTVDSYGRVSLAVHQGSAAGTYGVTLDRLIEVLDPRDPARARPLRRASRAGSSTGVRGATNSPASARPSAAVPTRSRPARFAA